MLIRDDVDDAIRRAVENLPVVFKSYPKDMPGDQLEAYLNPTDGIRIHPREEFSSRCKSVDLSMLLSAQSGTVDVWSGAVKIIRDGVKYTLYTEFPTKETFEKLHKGL